MSTLDSADIDVMKSTKTCAAATRFQYDYLNDDITPEGKIDYTLTNKVPAALQEAIAAGKKILVLINPPYAEAMNADNVGDADTGDAKVGVATTKVAATMDRHGYASRELFTQFLVRIAQELPTATVAMFSKLKYVNAPNFAQFRERWRAKYLGGFVVHSKAFDGLRGDFPIGFLIWQTNHLPESKLPPLTTVTATVRNRHALPTGEKVFYAAPAEALLGEWIPRPRPNTQDALPLSNALTPTIAKKDIRGRKWADGAIGGFMCKGSDMQNAGTGTALFSSGYGSAGGMLVTPGNLAQVAVAFTVRLAIKKTWLNDRDQLLSPTQPLPADFQNDCLIWMLFHPQNLTAGANRLLKFGAEYKSLV